MELSYQTLKFTHQAREAVRKAYTKKELYYQELLSPCCCGPIRVSPVAMVAESAARVEQAQSLGTGFEAGVREGWVWDAGGFGLDNGFDERDGRVGL